MMIWLIGAAGAWLLLDFCYYGNTISTPAILTLLNPHASELHNVIVQLLIFVVFALPGYIVAILLLDKTGRRPIQILGFGMMAFLIEKVSAVAPSPKVPLSTVVAEGDPAESLITAAKGADLLVVGTHGRSTLRGLLVGAVSLRCIMGAPCPVTVVKLPNEVTDAAPEGTEPG